MIERCRDAYPIRMMCRCLNVSPSGYYDWRERPLSPRAQENVRLSERIEGLHADSEGVLGSPRIWEDLRYAGESCGKNRVARLMRQMGLQGIPQRSRWRKKPSTQRPDGILNHLERDFQALEPSITVDFADALTNDVFAAATAACDACRTFADLFKATA